MYKRALIVFSLWIIVQVPVLLAQGFPCDGKLYFGSSGATCGISSIAGYASGTPTVTLVCPITSGGGMNALGANPVDHKLYFCGQGGLRRMDADCNDVLVCPGISATSGCFDNLGRYWIPGGGGIIGYDIATCTVVKTIPFTVTVPGPDVTFNPCDSKFYWCGQNAMMSLDTNGAVTTYSIGFGGPGNFGGIAMGSDGNLYGMPNNASDLYRFNPNSLTAGRALSTSSVTSCGHDMASFPCKMIKPKFSAAVQCHQTVQFRDSTEGWVSKWKWSFGDGETDTTSKNPSHTYSAPGTYAVSLYAGPNSFCQEISSSTFSMSIVVPPAYSVTVSSPVTICPGNSAVLTAAGGTTYVWSNGATTSSISVSPATTASYKVVAANGTCRDSASTTVSVSVPVAAFSVPATICFNNPCVFTDQSAGGNTSWAWNFGDGKSSSLQSPSHTYNSPGAYPVTLVVTTPQGCRDSITHTLNVNPLPSVSFSSTTVCVSSPTCFTDLSTISSGTLSSWSWNFGDPGLAGNVSNVQMPCVTYTASGTYTVLLTVTSFSGCQSSALLPAWVNPPPAASFTVSNICSSIPAAFANTTAGGANQWLWRFGDGDSSSLQNPSHTYKTDGHYRVTLTASSGSACSDSTARTITVYDLPKVNFAADSACLGSSTSFLDGSSAASGNLSAWSWNFGDPVSGSGNSSSLQNPLHTFSSAGTFPVTLTATSAMGCTNSFSRTVQVFPKPIADFSSSPGPNLLLTDQVSFKDLSSGNATKWLWDMGDGTQDSSRSPCHTYHDIGFYLVRLTVATSHGCVDTIDYPLTVKDFAFYMPTSFSPNQDNNNELFFGKGTGITQYELSIFDRWGNLIFYCNVDDLPQSGPCQWDGSVMGIGSKKAAQDDLYLWKVHLTNIFRKEFNYTGMVTLIK